MSRTFNPHAQIGDYVTDVRTNIDDETYLSNVYGIEMLEGDAVWDLINNREYDTIELWAIAAVEEENSGNAFEKFHRNGYDEE